MKKMTFTVLGIVFLMAMLPLTHAAEDAAVGTTPDPTPQEVASMEKSLQSERLDNIEQGIAGLQETISELTERVSDLERTVFDDNGRT